LEGALELFFTVAFTAELLVRMLVGSTFWAGSEWQWNLVDFGLVLASLVETVIKASGFEMNYFRLLRVLRMLRSTRIFRLVRFFRTLRLMLLSVLNSVLPLLWALAFLILMIFVFSVILVQGVASHIRDAPIGDEGVGHMIAYFDSLPMTLLTLFMAVSGGISWWDAATPLLDISVVYVLVFAFYVSVMVLGVLNIVTGIFVNDAVEMAQMDRDLLSQTEIQRKNGLFGELRALFAELDQDNSGTLTFDEFENCMQQLETQAYLQGLGLDVSNVKGVFALLDVDGSEELEIEEFVMGCMHFKGLAKTVDMATLIRENKRIMKRWVLASNGTAQRLAQLEVGVREVLSHFRANDALIRNMMAGQIVGG